MPTVYIQLIWQHALAQTPLLQFTLHCNTHPLWLTWILITRTHRTAYPQSVTTSTSSDDNLSMFHYLSDTDSVDTVVAPQLDVLNNVSPVNRESCF